VSAEGVAPTPLLLVSALPVPLQPANITVVVVTARRSKVFIRNIGISSLLGRHSERLPAVWRINNVDDMSLSYDNGM